MPVCSEIHLPSSSVAWGGTFFCSVQSLPFSMTQKVFHPTRLLSPKTPSPKDQKLVGHQKCFKRMHQTRLEKNQWCIIIILFFFKVFSLSVLLRFSSVLNLDHNPIVYLHKWNILPGHCMWDFSLKESFLVVSHQRLLYGKGQPLFFSSFFPKQIKDTGAYIFYNMSFCWCYLSEEL